MDSFPAFFPLRDRTVVVAGEGEAAEAKVRLFDRSPALLRRLPTAAAGEAAGYAGAALAFIALPGEAATRAAAAARSAGVPVNVVDRPELCDFTTPAIVDRGAVVGAISTGGAAPVLATLLRGELETLWPADLGERAALVAALQGEIRAALPAQGARRAFLRRLLAEPATDAEGVRCALADAERIPPGRVVEIAAGGPAANLRLHELRTLAEADVLAVEPGCDGEVLAFARRDAVRTGLLAEAEAAARAAAGAVVVVCRATPTPS